MDDMFVREWDDLLPHVEDDLRTGAFEMNCKQCGRPIFESIEGEPICSFCWSKNQMDPEEIAREAEVVAWLAEQNREAERCRKAGICYVCDEPMDNTGGHGHT